MTDEQKLLQDDLEEIRGRIEGGSIHAMLHYALDGITNHRNDAQELASRLEFLLGAKHSDTLNLKFALGVLAAVANDRVTYENVLRSFGDDIPPVLPYEAYRQVKLKDRQKRKSDEWCHALELSNRLGYIPARFEIYSDRQDGISGYLRMKVAEIWFSILAAILRRRNPGDKRLPYRSGEYEVLSSRGVPEQKSLRD